MGKQPTQAAWVQALKTFEYLLNERIAAGADEDARKCLYAVHGLLRIRSSGEPQALEDSDTLIGANDALR